MNPKRSLVNILLHGKAGEPRQRQTVKRESVIRGVRLLGIAATCAVAGALTFHYLSGGDRLPEGLASGNGRIEATEVDIATKFAGRLRSVLVREGDAVVSGEIVATMDTSELRAELEGADARLQQAVASLQYSQAVAAQRRSDLNYARLELKRLKTLRAHGHVSEESVDRASNAAASALAALNAAQGQVSAATAGIAAAKAAVARINVNLTDSKLKTPVSGRVLYRLSEPGEVLASGGKVLTVVDMSDVYMTIFLPAAQAGRLRIGSEARVTLDAAPHVVIPATVTFVSPQAQFTPKEVETHSEREKLMFRVKVRIKPAVISIYRSRIKTGMRGEAYVRYEMTTHWPDWLKVRLPHV